MRRYTWAAVAALSTAAIGGTAQAAPTPSFVFTPGVYTPTAASATTVFETFDGATGGFTTRTNAFATETSSGVVNVLPGSTSNIGVNPDGGSDNYLSVGGPNASSGTFTVDFTKGGTVTSAIQYFSFALGSLDNYNTLTLNYADGSIFLSGRGIITGNTALNTTAGAPYATIAGGTVTGRLNIYGNGGSALNNVVFGSAIGSFEIDSLAAATPEPATWAMLILGFGLAGTAFRLRRRKATIAFA